MFLWNVRSVTPVCVEADMSLCAQLILDATSVHVVIINTLHSARFRRRARQVLNSNTYSTSRAAQSCL